MTRRILLAVEAYSPQTITEALYALTQTQRPPFIPDEIRIITTERGRDIVRQALVYDEHLQRLCDDYGLPAACAEPHFHLITDPHGNLLWDVRSEQDNEHTADFISQHLQQLTAEPDTTLRVLLSGGRRSMTFYVGYALSLFGRPQDRLQHVLVDDCYFFLSDFYYPPPQTTWQTDRDGREFDASKVEVTLADIPFVRLREGLPRELLEGERSFSATIAAAQHRFDPPQVTLGVHPPTLVCGGVNVTMPPVQLAFYAWMLQRCRDRLPPLHWTDEETPATATQFLRVYEHLYGKTGGYEQAARALADGLTRAWFDERKSKVCKALEQALGKQAAQPYLLQAHGKRPRTRFGLDLPPETINLHT